MTATRERRTVTKVYDCGDQRLIVEPPPLPRRDGWGESVTRVTTKSTGLSLDSGIAVGQGVSQVGVAENIVGCILVCSFGVLKQASRPWRSSETGDAKPNRTGAKSGCARCVAEDGEREMSDDMSLFGFCWFVYAGNLGVADFLGRRISATTPPGPSIGSGSPLI